MADVDRQMRSLRAAALTTERQAQRAILAAWRSTWQGLTPLLDGLLTVAHQARLQGARLTQAWFTRQPAYRSLVGALSATLGRFVALTGSLVASARYGVAAAIAPLAATVVGAVTGLAATALTVAPLVPGVAPLMLVAGLVKALPGIVADVLRAVRQAIFRDVPARQVATVARQAANTVPVRALATSRANVHEAAREAALATYRLHPEAIGKWRWVASLGPRCCPLCFARHGSLYPLTRSMDTHAGCRCLCAPEPHESTVQAETGAAVFARLPEATQRQILGPGKLALYQSGMLTLDDLVVPTQSARYGPGMREKSLRELMAG